MPSFTEEVVSKKRKPRGCVPKYQFCVVVFFLFLALEQAEREGGEEWRRSDFNKAKYWQT